MAIVASGPLFAAASAASSTAAAAALDRHVPVTPPTLDGLGIGPGAERATLGDVASQIERDVPLLDQLAQVMPAADVLVGGAMLLLIVLIHATGMRALTNGFERRLQSVRSMQSTWRPDLLLIGVVALMLVLHLLEIFAWSAALVWGGLVSDWRAAGFFAANTYTTVGYGNFVLPNGWHMLAPIIAISGLFALGWTGSVLVEVVRRCQEAKVAIAHARSERPRRRAADPQAPR